MTVDSELELNRHINEKVNKANRIMAVIRRTFSCLDDTNFLSIYKVLVRSQLEYAASVWSLYTQKNIDAIENVQKRTTK